MKLVIVNTPIDNKFITFRTTLFYYLYSALSKINFRTENKRKQQKSISEPLTVLDTTPLITIQNTMRRILENYFSILGKAKDDSIVESFDTAEKQMICHSLLSWLNDGSHSIPDDLRIDSYNDSIKHFKEVFKEVFVRMGHKAHYNMMMRISK